MMSVLNPIITQLILDTVLHKPVKAVVAKKKAAWWLLALSILFVTAGLVYLMVALHLYLLTIYLPVQAALLTGGTCLMLGAIGGIGYVLLEDKRKLKAKAEAALNMGRENQMMALIDDLTKSLEEPIANNPRTSVVLASLAGFLTGHRIH